MEERIIQTEVIILIWRCAQDAHKTTAVIRKIVSNPSCSDITQEPVKVVFEKSSETPLTRVE